MLFQVPWYLVHDKKETVQTVACFNSSTRAKTTKKNAAQT